MTPEQIDYSGCYTLDDHLARWWETTAWDEVLTGWTLAGRDECGCDTWTRPHDPGERVTPKSLTTHDRGCSRPRTDERHPAAHVWSDHVDDDLLDMTQRFGRTLSAFAVFTALHFHGDFADACRAVGMPSSCAQDLTELGTNFDDAELWDAHPVLTTIRENARLLGVDPYGLLNGDLTEVALRVPPYLVMDNPHPVSLNLFILLVGNPGAGKGVTLDFARGSVVADNALRAQKYLHDPVTMKGFTGEGLARAFERVEPDEQAEDDDSDTGVRHDRSHDRSQAVAIRFREDEVSAFTAKAADPRSTHYPVLNSAFMGEELGATLADSRRSFHVEPHAGRMVLQLAGQPSTVGDLFTGQAEGSGFTARLLVADVWINAEDVEDVDPAAVDRTPVRIDYDTILTDPVPGTHLRAIRTDPAIVAELNRARVMRNVRGADAERSDADGHAGLLRRKVATLLAIMVGDRQVELPHWHLAGYVVANSQRTVTQWRAEAAKVARQRRRDGAAEKLADDLAGARLMLDRQVDAAVAYVVKKCGTAGGSINLTELHRNGPVDRSMTDEVYALLRDDERVKVVETTARNGRAVEKISPAGEKRG